MVNSKEAFSRIKINKLLEKSGWRFFDNEEGEANICLEDNVKITQQHIDEFGNDFEKTKNGFIDYLLLDDKGFPFVVLEAKKSTIHPLNAKRQTRKYKKNINARFVILSNGDSHFLWDLEKGDPEATTKEKQLIGRGVRYFPFIFNDKIKNKRKFDDDLKHELRILEELYYYTYDEESKYISHLKAELRKEGYFKDSKITKDFGLKKEFQESDFYKNVKIWYNKPVDNPNRKKKTLEDIKKDFFVQYEIKSLEFTEQGIDFEKQEDLQRLNLQEKGLKKISIKFKDIEKHIIQKAINIKAKQENSLFQFEKLKEELEIETIEQLRTDKLADFDVKIIVSKNTNYDDIDNSDKLGLVMKFLDNIFAELKENIAPKIGGEFIAGDFKKFFAEPKTKTIEEDADSQRVAEDLKAEKWYVLDSFHGTSEERKLIKFIQEIIGNLEEKYKEIYLLRNEEIYKIYDFKKGRGFQPDFILFLKTNDKKEVGVVKTELYYQIFIEPKGNQYLGNDRTFKTGKEGWKEEFLEEIAKKYGLNEVIKSENPNYRLIGLPFFNKENPSSFKNKFSEIVNYKKHTNYKG